MGKLIEGIVIFIITCGIPWYLNEKKEKRDAGCQADEFMRFHFGDDYKKK